MCKLTIRSPQIVIFLVWVSAGAQVDFLTVIRVLEDICESQSFLIASGGQNIT